MSKAGCSHLCYGYGEGNEVTERESHEWEVEEEMEDWQNHEEPLSSKIVDKFKEWLVYVHIQQLI